ncbi:ROK family transcriptional regulator [Pseudomonas sp. NPDC090592]|uniref:ROK family transcriptional regulator n=1 Tax=Pseudomonas sp. NPDC090592 TaxID=3364480 RepID=UPI00383A1DF2
MLNDSSPSAQQSRTGSVEEVLSVLRSKGPQSQAELVRMTGLSKGTVNNVVKRLLSEGVVSLQQKNRKEAWVTLGVGVDAIATVEVQAQALRGVLFDFDRGLRFEHVLETDQNRDVLNCPDGVVQLLRYLGEISGVNQAKLACVSVAIQASIDRSTGAIVEWAAGRLPGWRGLKLSHHLEALLGVPVLVDNDANQAAYGEWTWGCGRGCEDFFYLYCAQGVGGGLILNGKIYRGGTGVAGEVGHMALVDGGPVCFCGGRGCLHSLVSERAILTALYTSESPQTSLRAVIDSARQGDAACRRVLFEAGLNLGRAVANTARVIAPSTIALGGLLSTAGDMVIDSMRSSPEMQNMLTISLTTRLVLAEIGDAVALGSVACALAHLGRGIAQLPDWMMGSPVSSDLVQAL